MKRGYVVAIGLGVAILLAGALWLMLANRPAKVQMAKVERGPAVELVYATGYVEPEHPVTISARLTAPVLAVLVEEGQRVVRGQPLVRLDDSQQRALLAQAEAQARGQTLAEQRTTSLYRQGWVTRAASDAAVASGQAARAAAAAARAQLDQMVVRAGIDGVILKREVEPGDLATPGTTLFELGDPARARVTATVDERDIPRVRIGQSTVLSTDALPGQVIRGRVTEITPGGDPDQRAFRVRIGPEGAGALPFGLTLEVNIVTRERANALLVPASAVAGDHVWVVSEGRARRVPVRIGIAGNEKVELLAGVSAGDTVIVDPSETLQDGDRVR